MFVLSFKNRTASYSICIFQLPNILKQSFVILIIIMGLLHTNPFEVCSPCIAPVNKISEISSYANFIAFTVGILCINIYKTCYKTVCFIFVDGFINRLFAYILCIAFE